jgi:hypothetical protein
MLLVDHLPVAAAETSSAKLGDFLLALSNLGRFHGFGITGDASVYLLERDDYLFDYSVDSCSRLRLGSALGYSNGNS